MGSWPAEIRTDNGQVILEPNPDYDGMIEILNEQGEGIRELFPEDLEYAEVAALFAGPIPRPLTI